MEQKIIDWLIRYRYGWSLLSLLLTLLLLPGAANLYVESDYKMFFTADNPRLLAQEAMEEEYTRSDRLNFILKPAEGDIYTKEMLIVVRELTDRLWEAPYALRVDSLANYQYSWAEGDDLIVEDLVEDPASLDQAGLAHVRRVATSEIELYNRLVAVNGRATIVSLTVDPPVVDSAATADLQEQQRQVWARTYPEVVAYARGIRQELMEANPGLEVHLLGIPVVNNAFLESPQKDLKTLMPAMYALIIVGLLLLLRSFGSVVGAVLVIAFSIGAAMSFGGWMGWHINPVTSAVPVVVLTIAVCDAVHLLVIYLRQLAQGDSREQAMRRSLEVNLQPVALTSVTTAVGFATLNFSISPPFQQFGSMTAFGVMYAMLLSLGLLPTVAILLARKGSSQQRSDQWLMKFADFVTANRRYVLLGTLAVALLLIAQIPRNQIDDDPIKYFKHGVPYRDAVEFSRPHLPGIKEMNFSLNCGEPGCIQQPEYLAMVAAFRGWLLEQPGVEHVATYVDVIKRLNRNMHGDDEHYYTIPESVELAAQYHLFYEMSLPYGLDMNNQVNFQKTATKVMLLTRQVTTGEFVGLEERAYAWLQQHYPESAGRGVSIHMMFAAMGEKNVRSLSVGALIALIGVTLTILMALKSLRYALISLVPNAFPAAMALGVWGLSVGEVNMGVATVFSVTLGIVVDDSVHFISKYRRALEVDGMSPGDAVHYAFHTVGVALIVTTAVLVLGFGLLAFSSFNVNAYMGSLTAITVLLALVFDFLVLPTLLMRFARKE